MDQDQPCDGASSFSSVSRRSFFRQFFLGGLESLEQAGHGLADLADPQARGPHERAGFLRPPGALPEPQLADACSRCGKCVAACPADCIKIDDAPAEAGADSRIAGGLPYIVASEAPCVVCEDLSCMKACPTGALTLVPANQIDMGTAKVDHGRCLRDAGRPSGSEDCRLCVSSCPLGADAIGLDGQGQIEVRDGCIGCGVCEWACPTKPPSIWVGSARAASGQREAGTG